MFEGDSVKVIHLTQLNWNSYNPRNNTRFKDLNEYQRRLYRKLIHAGVANAIVEASKINENNFCTDMK
jgi:hypothetical protein